MKLFLAVWMLFILCPLMAGLRLESSIVDVDYRGNHQLAGTCVIDLGVDVFANASPGTPKYLAIRPESGAVLADTLVLQNGPAAVATPINLPMILNGEPDVSVAAAADAVRIVRWVVGENLIWLEIRQSSATWLSRGGQSMSPDSTNRVTCMIGLSARNSDQYATMGASANLPFASRQTNVAEGNFAAAVSTLLCLDFRQSTLTSSSATSLLNVELLPCESDANVGGGLYALNTRISCLTLGPEWVIARGLARGCSQTNFQTSAPVLLAGPNGWSRIQNRLSADLTCASGTGNGYLTTVWAEGSRLVLQALGTHAGFGDNPQVGFTQGWSGYAQVRPETAFTHNGLTLYREAELIFTGSDQPTNQQNIEFNLELFYPTGSASPDVAVETVLLPFASAADSAPYNGVAQHRYCEPQPLALPNQTVALGGPSVPALNPIGLTALVASLLLVALIRRHAKSALAN